MDQNDNVPLPFTATSVPYTYELYDMDDAETLQEQVDALTHELVCTLRELGL